MTKSINTSKSKLILIDGNNLGFSGMASPRLSAGEKDTQSIFTTMRRIRKIILNHPNDMLLVLWDGKSWRKEYLKEYKENRTASVKQVEARKEYFDQRKEIVTGLHLLGIYQASADNMEADDLAAYYTDKYLGEVKLITADKDWLQLVGPTCEWYDPINDRQCTDLNFTAFTGCKDVKQFIERKCFEGDAGDNIKGVLGVGKVTLNKIYEHFDSVFDFLALENPVSFWADNIGGKQPKSLFELHENNELKNIINRNCLLMDLRHKDIPAAKRLSFMAEIGDKAGFSDYCDRLAFLSFKQDLDNFLRPFEVNKFVRI